MTHLTHMTRSYLVKKHLLLILGMLLLALTLVAPGAHVSATPPDTTVGTARPVPAAVSNADLTLTETTGSAIGPFVPYGTSGKATIQNTVDLTYCAIARNIVVSVMETTATITFDTCKQIRTILNIYREGQTGTFGSGQAFDDVPKLRHTLVLTNLEAATAYTYRISDGMGNEIGDGRFVTRMPQVLNLRVQPGTTTVHIAFDTTSITAPTVILATPGRADIRLDLPRSQHPEMEYAGLKPGTLYTYTILFEGRFAIAGQFKTGVVIDNGPDLHASPD